MRPIIGITGGFGPDPSSKDRLRTYLNAGYTDAILRAGGVPVILPTPAEWDETLLADILRGCDGVMFSGGPDLHSRHYGEPLHDKSEVLHDRRDRFDIALFRMADGTPGFPILAVCLGSQITNVARGGKLVQHVDDLNAAPLTVHHDEDDAASHPIRILPDSQLAQVMGLTQCEINSRHHQVVHEQHIGGGLRPVAFAPDGIIEGTEDPRPDKFLIAVQWHPEDMLDRPEQRRLFEGLIAAARIHATGRYRASD